MAGRFVGETLRPVAGAFSSRRMAKGEPGLPARFVWRGTEHEVAEVVETWRETAPCRSGAGEEYVRKHWYRVRTDTGYEMRIYFERTPRARRRQWRIFTASSIEDVHD